MATVAWDVLDAAAAILGLDSYLGLDIMWDWIVICPSFLFYSFPTPGTHLSISEPVEGYPVSQWFLILANPSLVCHHHHPFPRAVCQTLRQSLFHLPSNWQIEWDQIRKSIPWMPWGVVHEFLISHPCTRRSLASFNTTAVSYQLKAM